ncbi:MAG: hypothetical protein QME74_01235, partial [Candidatus Edwardsbacteria bacterium]|nr:hypothetical protein [Candidatus Edwardsbacteria bacterium]
MIRPVHCYRPRILWAGAVTLRPRPVLLAKAGVLELTGRWPEAEAIHRDDLEWSLPGGADAAEAALALSRLLLKRTAYDEARSLLAGVRGFFEKAGDRRRLFECLMDSGQLLRRQGQTDASTVEYEKSLAIARGLGDRSLESHVLLELGINRYTF